MMFITTFKVPPSGSRPKCRPDASQCGGNLLLTRHLLTQFLACISQARPQGLLKAQGLPRLGDLLRQQGLFTLQGKLFLLAVPLLPLRDGPFYLLQSGYQAFGLNPLTNLQHPALLLHLLTLGRTGEAAQTCGLVALPHAPLLRLMRS